ncbi:MULTISPECIES: hypothetical protein [Bacillus]|uniref:hypothetical protein n=1 Tax=Bacillus TaxID=1386 RepID=UPI0003E2601D|nr:hypothetical protein [Bacillus cereus]ETT88852.1 hypothetical protein C175_00050 [Bacillus cereus]OOR38500.1 hypothetical protein BW895_21375 [Bacillus cereus]
MVNAPKLLPGDSLRTGYPKINHGINNANEALNRSMTAESNSRGAMNVANDAVNVANDAKSETNSIQEQLNQLVIDGDSSVEAAQARVDENGNLHPTLKARIDADSNKIGVLQKKANRISIKEYEDLKVAITEGYDWAPAIIKAVADATITKKEIDLHTDDPNAYIAQPVKLTPSIKLIGQGTYNTIFKLKGAIKAFDLSDSAAKIGLNISSIGFVGDQTIGQTAIDAFYLVNGSVIRDIRIENTDIGMRIQKSWYASINNIFMRGNVSYGIKVESTSINDQVNGIEFNNCFIQGGDHCIYVTGGYRAMALHFNTCTFEASKQTAVVLELASPVKFTSCYWERNFSDAVSNGVTLTWDKPTDVRISSTSVPGSVKFESCIFSRRNDFISSSEKTGIYIVNDTMVTLESCFFMCNTVSYIDSNVYNNGTIPTRFFNNSFDGAPKKFYTGPQERMFVKMLDDRVDLAYASTLDNVGALFINDSGDYEICFIPETTVTLTSTPSFKLVDVMNGTDVYYNITLPLNLVKGQIYSFKLRPINPTVTEKNLLRIQLYTFANTSIWGYLYLNRLTPSQNLNMDSLTL